MLKEPYYEITKTIHNIPINIYIHKKSPIQIIEAHWHRALELSIVFEGEVEFYNENRKKRCQKKEVNLSNCEEIHYSIPQYKEFENKDVGYTLQINYNFLKSMIPDINEIYFDISEPLVNQEISQNMIKIYKLYKSHSETKFIKIYALVLEIINILYEKCKNKKTIVSTRKTKEIYFDLESTVYNYGESIDKVILDTSNLKVDEDSITKDTFEVYATATSPYTDQQILDMIEKDGLVHCGLYNQIEREVD